MQKIVVDASVILVIMFNEPSLQKALKILELSSSYLSSVNLAEVLSKAKDYTNDQQKVIQLIEALDIKIVSFNQKHAEISAELQLLTRSKGLSLGDRACLATASELQAEAITADRVWGELGLDIPVVCIR